MRHPKFCYDELKRAKVRRSAQGKASLYRSKSSDLLTSKLANIIDHADNPLEDRQSFIVPFFSLCFSIFFARQTRDIQPMIKLNRFFDRFLSYARDS